MMTVIDATDVPVRKIITVNVGTDRAFKVFTEGFDTWGYEPDLEKASEVEVRFTPQAGGGTRVDLEHRHFNRLGPGGGATMRVGVNAEGGWGSLLEAFKQTAEKV